MESQPHTGESCSCLWSNCSFEFAFDHKSFSDIALRIEVLDAGVDEAADVLPGDDKRDGHLEDDFLEITKAFRLRLQDESEATDVTIIHISSIIVAAHSPFFFELLTNKRRESKGKEATLIVQCVSEKVAVIDILKFVYSGRLQSVEAERLLNAIKCAKKYEFSECIRRFISAFLSLPMTMDLAVQCLELQSSLQSEDSIQPLSRAATSFLVHQFKNLHGCKREARKLPLTAIEAVLASDELEVNSEDDVYQFVCEWLDRNYAVSEERNRVFLNNLVPLIRFPMMSLRRLRIIQSKVCAAGRTQGDQEAVCAAKRTQGDEDKRPVMLIPSQLLLQAFAFKSELPYKRKLWSKGVHVSVKSFNERVYLLKHVHVVEFQSPKRHFAAYVDISRGDYDALGLNDGKITTESFELELGTFHLVLNRPFTLQWNKEALAVRIATEVSSLRPGEDAEVTLRARSRPSWDFQTMRTMKVSKGRLNENGAWMTLSLAETTSYFDSDLLSLCVEFASVAARP